MRTGLKFDHFIQNYQRLFQLFPDAVFFFSSWIDYKDKLNSVLSKFGKSGLFFDEPVLKYHPFIDNDLLDHNAKFAKTKLQAKINQKFKETSSNQTKQILAHSLLVQQIQESIDIFIRVRHDTLISSNANFGPLIIQSYLENIPIGFATLKEHWKTFDYIHEVTRNSNYHLNFLFDQLIIHSANNLNLDEVFSLHDNKLLLPAEFGWWQILSKSEDHRCFSGWANPDKSVLKEYLNK